MWSDGVLDYFNLLCPLQQVPLYAAIICDVSLYNVIAYNVILQCPFSKPSSMMAAGRGA